MTEPTGGCRAWLSLGSNLGDREGAIRDALHRLDGSPGIRVHTVSGFYETTPWGEANQPAFLNMAAEVETTLAPHALLDACQAAEAGGGRVRGTRWGPRTIDIDIVAIEGVRSAEPRLTLPHPHWRERAFVLVPLAEIAADLVINGVPVSEAARAIGTAGVVPLRCPAIEAQPKTG